MWMFKAVILVWLYHFTSFADKQGIIHDDVSWFQTPLLDVPALKYELEFEIVFPIEKCCPIMYLPNTLPVRYSFSEVKCYTNVTTEGLQHWFKHMTFVLPNINPNFGSCVKDEQQGIYTCNINTYGMNYIPEERWLTFGYLCNTTKSLKGLEYSYKTVLKNTTSCERLSLKGKEIPYFHCEKYYDYVTFPNLFGDRTLEDALQHLQLFGGWVQQMTKPCYQHLDYVLCQAFLPRCPEEQSNSQINDSLNSREVSYIVPICQEMCWDNWYSCKQALDPVINYVNCFYYKQKEKLNFCIYKNVSCETPTHIENGKLKGKARKSYPVGAKVQYSCNDDFKIKGNSTSICGYSGTWSIPPKCENIILTKIIIIMLPILILLLIIFVLFLTCYLHYRRVSDSKKYFENQPLEKRNRDFDAFLSYYSDVHKVHPDRSFAWNILNKLEKETSPPLKMLIHERNFIAGRPIFENIVNAVKHSNAAIVILSQDYIDASWCREEFTVRECSLFM